MKGLESVLTRGLYNFGVICLLQAFLNGNGHGNGHADHGVVACDLETHHLKWYATEIYKANGCDIALVQRLLQHSSAATTQRYIGIEPQRIEQAIQNHAHLL